MLSGRYFIVSNYAVVEPQQLEVEMLDVEEIEDAEFYEAVQAQKKKQGNQGGTKSVIAVIVSLHMVPSL